MPKNSALRWRTLHVKSLFFVLVLLVFSGKVEAVGTAGENGLAEGEGFFGFEDSFVLPDGLALVSLHFGGFLLGLSHDRVS